MKFDFVCPKCGEELYFWVVPVIDELRKVNPSTGELAKTANRIEVGYTDQFGFQCQDKKCNWITNIVGDVPVNESFEKWAIEHHEEIIKLIEGK